MSRPTEMQYQKAAHRLFHEDGEIEVDVGAGIPTGTVSPSDDGGAYVLAWVWVPNEEAVKESKWLPA